MMQKVAKTVAERKAFGHWVDQKVQWKYQRYGTYIVSENARGKIPALTEEKVDTNSQC